jgi:hypothetical protein
MRAIVNEASQHDIALAHPTTFMRGQHNINPAIDIGPFGMVIRFFRAQGDPRHEPPCRVETGKLKGFPDCVPVIAFDPSVQFG